MALFLVRQQHPAERGPSAKAGISINGEAVVNNEHTLYLIRLAGQSRPMTRLHREE